MNTIRKSVLNKTEMQTWRVFCFRLYIIFDGIRNFLFLFYDISILVGVDETLLRFRFDSLLKSSDTTGQPRYFIKSFLNVSCERVNLLKSRIRKHQQRENVYRRFGLELQGNTHALLNKSAFLCIAFISILYTVIILFFTTANDENLFPFNASN